MRLGPEIQMANTRKTLTVVVDSREQTPFLFPQHIQLNGKHRRIKTVTRKLDIGDYALAGAETDAVVERKGHISEIAKNMLDPKDRKRQLAAFDRLATVEYPVIVVESTLADLTRPSRRVPEPALALDRLLDAAMQRGIQIMLIGRCGMPDKRRMAGELVVRLLGGWREHRAHD